MTATCLNTNGIEAVLRICCCASGSIVLHGRKSTTLSLTVSTPLRLMSSRRPGQERRRAEPWPLVDLGSAFRAHATSLRVAVDPADAQGSLPCAQLKRGSV